MKEIEFHFNVPDKLEYSCRLLRKVYRTGSRAVVTADPVLLDALDRLLWQFSAADFLPHCQATGPRISVDASPIVLAAHIDDTLDASVLINIGHDIPQGFERFERFIEIVSEREDDRILGRRRWKQYKEGGWACAATKGQPSGEGA